MIIDKFVHNSKEYILMEVPEDATEIFLGFGGMIFYKRNKPPQLTGTKFTYLHKNFHMNKKIIGRLSELNNDLINDLNHNETFLTWTIKSERTLLCENTDRKQIEDGWNSTKEFDNVRIIDNEPVDNIVEKRNKDNIFTTYDILWIEVSKMNAKHKKYISSFLQDFHIRKNQIRSLYNSQIFDYIVELFRNDYENRINKLVEKGYESKFLSFLQNYIKTEIKIIYKLKKKEK